MDVAAWTIAVLVAAQLLPMFLFGLRSRPLVELLDRARLQARPAAQWPEVTVVVPARDEEAAIEAAVRSLLALDYPRLRVVALDDRSRDRTGAILDRLAAESERLEVVHIGELPAGWLGKNHANWVGARRTDSPWILFTDGDIVFAPDALRLAVAYATQQEVDHLTALPELEPGGFLENLLVSTFSLFFLVRFPPALVRSRARWAYVGVGAFNLIRREAYEAIGSHVRLAMEVADDIKLGKLIKRHGLRQDIVEGRGSLRVRWQIGAGGVVRGLEKNAFAGLDYSLPMAAASTAILLASFVFPYAGVFLASGMARWVFLGTLVLLHAVFLGIVLKLRRHPLVSLFLPVGVLLFLYAVWRSIVITLKRGGVVWRDTFYPLDVLRKGVV